MSILDYIRERFQESQAAKGSAKLKPVEQHAFNAFTKMGIPVKHEEWKYTRISNVFNKDYQFANASTVPINLDEIRLPGYEQANELVFVNGVFSPEYSQVKSAELVILPLEEAAETVDYADIVLKHLGHSSQHMKDGVNALNTAFVHGGVFIFIGAGEIAEHPVYIYNITDASENNVFAQPRTLVYVSERAQLQMMETYKTI